MFKIKKCTDNKGLVTLNGQLKLGNYCCTLPIVLGKNTFTIQVKTGKLRLNHSAFNIDGATFTCPPQAYPFSYMYYPY